MGNTLKYILKSKVIFKGNPYSTEKREKAKEYADKQELKKFGKRRCDIEEHFMRLLPKNEVWAKNTKIGNVIMSKKVPPKFRKETLFYEHEFFKYLHR